MRAVFLVAVVCSMWLSGAGPALGQSGSTIRVRLADGFDFPVGKPEATGYHKARGYWPNGHLGEDWNGNGGGDTDLGAPIYSMGRGVVIFSQNIGVGWGNCVLVRHVFRELDGRIAMVDSSTPIFTRERSSCTSSSKRETWWARWAATTAYTSSTSTLRFARICTSA